MIIITYKNNSYFGWELDEILKSIITNRLINQLSHQNGFLSLPVFAVACFKNVSSGIISIME